MSNARTKIIFHCLITSFTMFAEPSLFWSMVGNIFGNPLVSSSSTRSAGMHHSLNDDSQAREPYYPDIKTNSNNQRHQRRRRQHTVCLHHLKIVLLIFIWSYMMRINNKIFDPSNYTAHVSNVSRKFLISMNAKNYAKHHFCCTICLWSDWCY